MLTRGFLLAFSVISWYMVSGVMAAVVFATTYSIGYVWIISSSRSHKLNRDKVLVKAIVKKSQSFN